MYDNIAKQAHDTIPPTQSTSFPSLAQLIFPAAPGRSAGRDQMLTTNNAKVNPPEI